MKRVSWSGVAGSDFGLRAHVERDDAQGCRPYRGSESAAAFSHRFAPDQRNFGSPVDDVQVIPQIFEGVATS